MELTKKKTSENASKHVFGKRKAKVEMGIAEEGYAFIVERLTKLYADPLAAAIRESMSNAFDSTVRSESGLPINVELTEDYIAIKDNGEGMDFDTLRYVFTQYGNSTKTDDLGQTGAYGLGAKAPLAYGNVFYVKSVKDGEEIHLELRVDEGINKAEVTYHKKTDELNGTEIVIPNNEKNSDEFIGLCKKHLSSYKDYNHAVDIVINGELCEPNNEMFVEEITIFDDINLTFRVMKADKQMTKSDKIDLLMNILFSSKFGYLISGWEYEKDRTSIGFPVLVDLPAGLLEFSSSRDEITKNSRFETVQRELSIKIALKLMEVLNIKIDLALIKELFHSAKRSFDQKIEFFDALTFKDYSLNELVLDTTETTILGGVKRSIGEFFSYSNSFDTREFKERYVYDESTSLEKAVKRVLSNGNDSCLTKGELLKGIGNEDLIFLISTSEETTKKAIKKSYVLPNANNVFIFVAKNQDKKELKKELAILTKLGISYEIMTDKKLAGMKKATRNLSEYGKVSCVLITNLSMVNNRSSRIYFKNDDMKTLIGTTTSNDLKNVLIVSNSSLYGEEYNIYFGTKNEEKLSERINLVTLEAKNLTSKNMLGFIDHFDEIYIQDKSKEVFGKKLISMLDDCNYTTFSRMTDEELLESFVGSTYAKHFLGDLLTPILNTYNKDFSNGIEYELKDEYKEITNTFRGNRDLRRNLKDCLVNTVDKKAYALANVKFGEERYVTDYNLSYICSESQNFNLNSGILGEQLRPMMKEFINLGVVIPK